MVRESFHDLLICLHFKVFWHIQIHKKRFPQGSKIQKSWNLEVLVFPGIKPKFHQTKIDPNNFPELSNLLFNHTSPINNPNKYQTSPKLCFPIFPNWSPNEAPKSSQNHLKSGSGHPRVLPAAPIISQNVPKLPKWAPGCQSGVTRLLSTPNHNMAACRKGGVNMKEYAKHNNAIFNYFLFLW